MKVGAAIAEILRREGVDTLFAYPLNFLIDYAADADIRPLITRTERGAVNMADAYSRVTSGRRIGVVATQHGPGIENAMGSIAQAYGESVPLLVLPMGYPRKEAQVDPNFSAATALRPFCKSVETINSGEQVPPILRRAFNQLRTGRGGPVVVEIPLDVWHDDVPEPLDYQPIVAVRYGPDVAAVKKAAELLVKADKPIIYAGQGVHYARAWPQLARLAEQLAIPVMTSLQGKSAFPENHPLAVGSGGAAMSGTANHFLQRADVIFGIGCSFTTSGFATAMPEGRKIIHATLDPKHLNKNLFASVGIIGDAGLVLDALLAEVELLVPGRRSSAQIAEEIAAAREQWWAKWKSKLTSTETPLTPYRVIWDLMQTVDVANTIITHDAGSPRDQLSPFWTSIAPLSYLGWGKTTQLGYGLGLAMGAKVACPDKLCINVWGDAAVGFTGMEFETAVRERIPVLSILLNNFCMAMETPVMKLSTNKYRTTDITGDYAAMARAFGGYGERITTCEEIVPALRRGIQQTRAGVPALLEFITRKELAISSFKPHFNAPLPRPDAAAVPRSTASAG